MHTCPSMTSNEHNFNNVFIILSDLGTMQTIPAHKESVPRNAKASTSLKYH